MNLKHAIKLSAIIDKLNLKITDPKASQEQIGADLMIQIISKAYKAEKEIYNFVSEFKNITVKEAEKINLVDFIKELGQVSGLGDFFKSAVKLNNHV